MTPVHRRVPHAQLITLSCYWQKPFTDATSRHINHVRLYLNENYGSLSDANDIVYKMHQASILPLLAFFFFGIVNVFNVSSSGIFSSYFNGDVFGTEPDLGLSWEKDPALLAFFEPLKFSREEGWIDSLEYVRCASLLPCSGPFLCGCPVSGFLVFLSPGDCSLWKLRISNKLDIFSGWSSSDCLDLRHVQFRANHVGDNKSPWLTSTQSSVVTS